MSAKYIYRMDDITPGMDWQQFYKFLKLFEKHGIKPLLGIVPDNKDSEIVVENDHTDFWEILRELKHRNMVEFSQHGYQHVYCTENAGLLGGKDGVANKSEFAGLPYEQQYTKIKAGRNILKSELIETDYFMAPSHSFDKNTLKAIHKLGFTAITDGIGLYAYSKEGIMLVPQQVWEPKRFFGGIITICLHTNTAKEILFEKVKKHVEGNSEFIRFSDALISEENILSRSANSIYFAINKVSNQAFVINAKNNLKRLSNDIFNTTL